MRWSIIRLLFQRELLDQLRDRRTVFMIVFLPVLLVPLAGTALSRLATGLFPKNVVVGIAGFDDSLTARHTGVWTPERVAASVSAFPSSPGSFLNSGPHIVSFFSPPMAFESARVLVSRGPCISLDPAGLELTLGAIARYLDREHRVVPPLFDYKEGRLSFRDEYLPRMVVDVGMEIRPISGNISDADESLQSSLGEEILQNRGLDALVVIPPGCWNQLAEGSSTVVQLVVKQDTPVGRLVQVWLQKIIQSWGSDARDARFYRKGLPMDFHQPIRFNEGSSGTSKQTGQSVNLLQMMLKIFPFILVIWSLAGALYPAVDLCAGEKERGTMETLLISPASREEIVWGKFLTIWLFSAATALLNLLSISFTTANMTWLSPGLSVRPVLVLWAVVLLLPLTAFFSAICLAIGVFARSTKEGQYYLMPLFFLILPLMFITLAPGVDLNPFFCMVPVTGVVLLLQRLLIVEIPDRQLWFYFLPVLAPILIYTWLALRWAIEQFQKEEVLFREADRIEVGLWVRHLMREKEPIPSSGEAVFCFAVLFGLQWLFMEKSGSLHLLPRTWIAQIAVVLSPPLFMAVLLTSSPWRSLGLYLVPLRSWILGACLACLLAIPVSVIFSQAAFMGASLSTNLDSIHPGSIVDRGMIDPSWKGGPFLLFTVLIFLPACCEEMVFRGFILQGLLRWYRPLPAILLAAFFFGAFQMDVPLFLPYFLLGSLLGFLAYRTGSIFPSILFRLVLNTLLLGSPRPGPGVEVSPAAPVENYRWVMGLISILLLLAGMLWMGLSPRKKPANFGSVTRESG